MFYSNGFKRMSTWLNDEEVKIKLGENLALEYAGIIIEGRRGFPQLKGLVALLGSITRRACQRRDQLSCVCR